MGQHTGTLVQRTICVIAHQSYIKIQTIVRASNEHNFAIGLNDNITGMICRRTDRGCYDAVIAERVIQAAV